MLQASIVVLGSFLLHWKIILGATICMDGWILENWKRSSSPESKKFFRSAGIPTVGYLHSVFRSGKFSQQKYGITIIISIAITNLAFLGVLQNIQPEKTNINYLLTCLFMTYSGKQMSIDMIVGLQYIFSYAVYLSALFILSNPALVESLLASHCSLQWYLCCC